MKLPAQMLILMIAAAAVMAEPGVKIPNDTFDFGKVVQNQTTTHSFWIKSTGSDTLRITEVVPGCGCTQMPLLDSVLGPGDSTRLDIVFTTRSFVGHVNKRPYVVTNTPTGKAGMSIFAEILTDPESAVPVVIRPPKLDVSQFTSQPRRRATFQVVNKSAQGLEVHLLDTAYKSFDIQLPARIKAGATVEGTVFVKKDRVASAFKESFTFEVVGADARDVYTLPVDRMYHVKDSVPASPVHR